LIVGFVDVIQVLAGNFALAFMPVPHQKASLRKANVAKFEETLISRWI
jgi:hypothetical protein